MPDQHEVVAEVEAAYRHYVATFNARDAQAVAALYDLPMAQVSTEAGLMTIGDEAGRQQWFELAMTHLDAAGWDHSDIAGLQVWPYSETVAQVVADVVRYHRDGSVLGRLRASYVLRRRPDGWKVVVTMPLIEEGFSEDLLPT